MAGTQLNSSVAVTGMACRFAGLEQTSELSQYLDKGDRAQPFARLNPSGSSYSEFGIPPIYRDSINRVQLLMFDLAREALQQAGLDDGDFDPEFTDVIFCTSFGLNRAYENFNRLYAQHILADIADQVPGLESHNFYDPLRDVIRQRFNPTTHDKVGEMASTIAARIASFFKLRGRAIAMEGKDGVGARALQTATESLRLGKASAVLVLSSQQLESRLLQEVLKAEGVSLADAENPENGYALTEGATAVLLTRGDESANKALCFIDEAKIEPDTNVQDLIDQSCKTETAFIDRLEQGVELSGEVKPVAEDVVVGSTQRVLGYQYGNSVLASLCATIEILRSARVPSAVFAGQQSVELDLDQAHCLVAGTTLSQDSFLISLRGKPALQTEQTEMNAADPVAIVGMGAQFGSANGLDAYWQALSDEHGSIRELDDKEFLNHHFRSQEIGAENSYYVSQASYIPTNMEPINGKPRDTYLRLQPYQVATATAMEAAAHCNLRDKKVLAVTATNLTTLHEKRAAFKYFFDELFDIVMSHCDSLSLHGTEQQRIQERLQQWEHLCQKKVALTDISASEVSAGVAEVFGAKAQTIAIEAACAGSFAALEIASNAIRCGSVDAAIVTGVELPVNTNDLCLCSSQRMLAPGVISTFSEDATGFTPGDGCGVVVLQRYEQAVAERQPVKAVVNAVAGCTESKSVIAPNVAGQVKSMQRAFAQVNYSSSDIQYLETHGTGTRIGDLVEIDSVAQVYPRQADNPLHLGALKTRFGHTFAAAGVASLIKVVLAIQKQQLPSNIIRGKVNPQLSADERHLDVLAHSRSFSELQQPPRYFAINAFGTGGVNYHVLLQSLADQTDTNIQQ